MRTIIKCKYESLSDKYPSYSLLKINESFIIGRGGRRIRIYWNIEHVIEFLWYCVKVDGDIKVNNIIIQRSCTRDYVQNTIMSTLV